MEMQSFNYPASGLLQKEVTQVAEFLNKNPTFDGRDTVIAVIDTGIDPAAMGMQKTSTGKPKVIDFIDCTGAGDVEMGPAQKCPEDKPLELVGASGRTLKLNSNWKNPSGDWHLGSKPLYSIAPKEVIRALSKERTEVHNKKQELIKIDIQRKQQQLKDDDEDSDETSDYKEQFKALDKLDGIYNDHGPLLDCVVFHDGKQWLAAIDTEESGDFTQVAAMGAYKSTGDIGMLCKRHLLYFTINFYDNGKILSIVTPSDTHSTHVSGIAAAFYPEEPANIGIAPGAQLLSLSIGDQRVNAMETGIAHMRAVNAVIEYNVDLANMSFGEPSSVSNAGVWIEHIKNKIINQHQCTFVSAGGNDGPALSTVNAPGGTTDDVIGVGAYLSKEQMISNHSMLNPTNDNVFTWSSYGPASNGNRGVDIYAPGCAISSYPVFGKSKLAFMNGTSMASPYVCGTIALLISAWKQTYGLSSKTISPYRIKNAILSTAKDFGNELGAGLIQVGAAWEFLKKYAGRSYEDVKLDVVNISLDKMSGIYLRDACDMEVPRYFKLNVSPIFHKSPKANYENDVDGSIGKEISEVMCGYEQRIILKSTVSWVKTAESVHVTNLGSTFEVCIDATNLEAGLLHTGAILGYDSSDIERGPVFDYPVTVTKPLDVDSSASISFENLVFKPADVKRRFINVPLGATTAKVTVTQNHRSEEKVPSGGIQLHLMQLQPETRFTKHEFSQYYFAGHETFISGNNVSKQSNDKTINVVGNSTIEVCAATHHTSQGTYNADIHISFSGIVPVAAIAGNQSDTVIVLNGNKAVERVDLTALVCPEYQLNPRISLDKLCKSLRPSKSKIVSLLSERDVHPATGTAGYQLKLNYKFTTKSDYADVYLEMAGLDGMIYEHWTDDFRLAIFDANKKCIAKNISYTENIQLDKKGDYFVQIQVCHQNKQELEALKDSCLLLEQDADYNSLSQINYELSQAFTKTIASSKYPREVHLGKVIPVFIKTEIKHMPDQASPGDILLGKFRVADNPVSYKVQYIVPTKLGNGSKYDPSTSASSSSEDNVGATDDTKESEEKETNSMEKAMRDLQISWIKSTESINVRDKLVSDLTASSKTEEDKMDVLIAHLESVDTYNRAAFPWTSKCGMTTERAIKVVEIADQIVEKTQATALTEPLYASYNEKKATDKEKEAKKKVDDAKEQITNALKSKCYAAAFLAANNMFTEKEKEIDVKTDDTDFKEKYKQALDQLVAWEDYNGSGMENMVLSLTLLVLEKKYAKALNKIFSHVEDTPLLVSNVKEHSAMSDLRDKLIKKLGWALWTDYLEAAAKFEIFEDYENF